MQTRLTEDLGFSCSLKKKGSKRGFHSHWRTIFVPPPPPPQKKVLLKKINIYFKLFYLNLNNIFLHYKEHF